MKKIIVVAVAAATVFSIACQPKNASKNNQGYVPEKTVPMELTQFEIIDLQRPDTKGGDALLTTMQNRRSTREFKDLNLSLKHLSDILWSANGINRPDIGKRTVPSAMAIYPLDTYAVLANGVYIYEPSSHRLIPVLEGDHRAATGMQPFVASAPLNLVFIADYGRYDEMPRERMLRAVCLDAGHCVQNVYLYAASEGLNVVERGSIDGPAFLELLGLDNTEHEVIIAQSVGY